jgi:hypothetical protein
MLKSTTDWDTIADWSGHDVRTLLAYCVVPSEEATKRARGRLDRLRPPTMRLVGPPGYAGDLDTGHGHRDWKRGIDAGPAAYPQTCVVTGRLDVPCRAFRPWRHPETGIMVAVREP